MCISCCSADVDSAVVAKGLSPALLTQPTRTFVRIDPILQLHTLTARKALLLSRSASAKASQLQDRPGLENDLWIGVHYVAIEPFLLAPIFRSPSPSPHIA